MKTKSTIIYADNEKDAESKVESKLGKVKRVEPLGLNHLKNPFFRVTFEVKEES